MFVMFSEPMGMTAQAFLPDAIAKSTGPDRTQPLPVVKLLRRIVPISAAISVFVAGLACAGPGLFPSLFTTDPLVVQEMWKILPLLFLLILPHHLTMCFEGVLLATRDIKYLTIIYSINTLAVALMMRAVATGLYAPFGEHT